MARLKHPGSWNWCLVILLAHHYSVSGQNVHLTSPHTRPACWGFTLRHRLDPHLSLPPWLRSLLLHPLPPPHASPRLHQLLQFHPSVHSCLPSPLSADLCFAGFLRLPGKAKNLTPPTFFPGPLSWACRPQHGGEHRARSEPSKGSRLASYSGRLHWILEGSLSLSIFTIIMTISSSVI